MSRATVTGVLRRFLPDYLRSNPPLSRQQWRAIWAITHCRTPALGGSCFVCTPCNRLQFAYHSCNHKACPQCGSRATKQWIERETQKLVGAPYFLVTFTLPSELRASFFGHHAKEFYDIFFEAVSTALAEKLATDKNLRAPHHGFTAVLHTWNQLILFHPHIHCLVPGAGLNANLKVVRVRDPKRLVHLPNLQAAFRQHMRRLMDQHGCQADPKVWTLDWGVHIQPAGSGTAALKYLGAYVARSAINDARMLSADEHSLTFRWKDRSDHNRSRTATLPGVEFVARYLRHVLPTGLRSIRHYGFHHPRSREKRLRLKLHTGVPVHLGASPFPATLLTPVPPPCCPYCGGPTRLFVSIPAPYKQRGPPKPRTRGLRPFATLNAAATAS